MEIRKFTRWDMVGIAMSPILSIMVNGFVLGKNLVNMKLLRSGRWHDYMGFNIHSAILFLFYKTQALNLQRNGFLGTSKCMAWGNFNLRNLWHQSYLSLAIYSVMGGAAISVLGMFAWLTSNLVWLSSVNIKGLPVFLTIVLTILSNNFLGNTFSRQNYNVLGWAIAPLAIWAIITGNLWLAIIMLVWIENFSITVLVMLSIFVFLISVIHMNYIMILSVFPATIISMIKIMVISEFSILELGKTLRSILAIISGKGKFYRKKTFISAGIISISLSIFPLSILLYGENKNILNQVEMATISIFIIGWIFINQSKIFRIADVQSMLMFFLTISCVFTILSNSIYVYLAFFISNSNYLIGKMLFSDDQKNKLSSAYAKVTHPVDILPIIDRVKQFLDGLNEGEKILMVLKDPKGDYNKIYYEHYPYLEALFHVGTLQKVCIIGDIYAIFSPENDYYWGYEKESLSKNILQSNSKYIIVDSKMTSSKILRKFKAYKIAELDWDFLPNFYKNYDSLEFDFPRWNLYRLRYRNLQKTI